MQEIENLSNASFMLPLTIWKSVGILNIWLPKSKTSRVYGYHCRDVWIVSFNFPITNKDISKEISQNKELIMKINNRFHVLLYILLIRIHSIKILWVNRTDNEKTNREGISYNIKKLIMVTMLVQRDLNFANT